MIPASMGLRFQVPRGPRPCHRDRVLGHLPLGEDRQGDRVGPDDRAPTSAPTSSRPVDLDLSDLEPGETTTVPVDGRRRAAGRRRRRRGRTTAGWSRSRCATTGRPRAGSRSTPGCSRPSCAVERRRRATSSCRSPTRFVDDWYEPDDELRRLKLQYRDRLEFAVGRTCSADWTVAEGARRATRGQHDLAADQRDTADPGRRDRGRPARHAGAGRRRRPRRAGGGAAADRRPSTAAGSTSRAGAAPTCPSTCGTTPARRSTTPAGRDQLADGLDFLLERRGGAALLPVHEPGDGRPAHPDARSPSAAPRTRG